MVELNEATLVPGRHERNVPIAAIGAGTADEIAIWRNNTGKTVVVKQFGYTPDTAVTGAATDYMALQAKVLTAAGAAAADLSDAKTYLAAVNITQWVEDTLTLSTTAADVEIDDGELLMLAKTENASGLALPAGVVSFEFEYK